MRASAAYVFGVIEYDDSVKYLLGALDDDCWFVVKNAIKSLLKKGSKTMPHLEKLLKSKLSDSLKMNIISVLGEIASPDCLKLLIPLLNDENGDIRQHTEAVIDKIQQKKAISSN
jgi:HEAT repeat protein